MIEGHMTKTLTAKSVENAKPWPAKKGERTGELVRAEIPDGGCPGLYLIVQTSGAKSWAVRYRHAGRLLKLTLGPVQALRDGEQVSRATIGRPLSLAAARKLATDALHDVANGLDPATTRKETKAASEKVAAERKRDTVEQLSKQFIEGYAKKRTRESSWGQTERIFDKDILAAWKGRNVHSITKRDIVDLLEKIAEDRPILANRALAVIRKWFNWMVSRDVIAASPCAGVERPSEESARDRVLTDDEIRALWKASGELTLGDNGKPLLDKMQDSIGPPFGPFLRMLVLTGQRRAEVSGMRWSEIDEKGKTWTLPATRTKNGREHIVPLSPQAMIILGDVKRIKGDHVFTTTGESGLGGFSRAKHRLDQKMGRTKPWVLHDLRRTVASGLQKLGIALPVVEKTLNHVSGSFGGIVGVYQRHSFDQEKRHALEAWAAHIEQLVSGKPSRKVVAISERRR